MSAAAIAIVVARGNSARLPGKALLPFAGTTLIGHKVRTLMQCWRVGRVVVGSDSPAILAHAARHGAETIRRDDYHCDESQCSANEMIADMIARVGGEDDQPILWAHPTNPLVRALTYDLAISAFDSAWAAGTHDSLMSVCPERRHAWFDGKPLNHDPSAAVHVPAAGLSPVEFQDGAIFIQTRQRWRETRRFYGDRPLAFALDWTEGWDVDIAAELAVAEALWARRQPSSVADDRSDFTRALPAST